MKKSWTILLVLIIVMINLVFVGGIFAEVRINEVMYHPECSYQKCEYIEIYSTEEINMTLIEKSGTTNKTININIINGYNIITRNIIDFLTIWSVSNVSEFSLMRLLDSGDLIWIYNNSIFLDSLNYTDMGANGNGKSLQYCLDSDSWLERTPTPGFENNCSTSQPPTDNTPSPPEISIEMIWDEDDIINGKGEEFKIEIIAENLDENKNYDVKVWIEFEDNDTKISQTYDENDEWVFSNEYYNDFFENDINESKDIKLRIHGDYKDYYSDARIYLKIKEEGGSLYKEIREDIEILKPKESNGNEVDEEDNEKSEILKSKSLPTITGAVIQLGKTKTDENPKTEDIKTENNIIYESKTEQIKKYSIYGFSLLCVGLSVLLVFKKLR